MPHRLHPTLGMHSLLWNNAALLCGSLFALLNSLHPAPLSTWALLEPQLFKAGAGHQNASHTNSCQSNSTMEPCGGTQLRKSWVVPTQTNSINLLAKTIA